MFATIPTPIPAMFGFPSSAPLPDLSVRSSKTASQALKTTTTQKAPSLSERQLAPVMNKKRLALEFTFGIFPGLIHVYLHHNYQNKIEKSASKLVMKINKALLKNDTAALISALVQAKKKINQISSRLFYRYLGVDKATVKMSLLCRILEKEAAGVDEFLKKIKAQFDKAPQNSSKEYIEAKNLIDGLIFFKKGLNGELPPIYIPQAEIDEMENFERPLSPTHFEFDDELELVDLPPPPTSPIEAKIASETETERTLSFDSTATTDEPDPTRTSTITTESDIACLHERTLSEMSAAPVLEPMPTPPHKSTPQELFLDQIKRFDCIQTKELFWTLFIGMNVENAIFDEKTGEFEIVLDQPYTVHVPSLKKRIEGAYPPPGPRAPQLKFGEVLRGKITKKDGIEMVEFQDCLMASGNLPIVGRKDVGYVKSMAIMPKTNGTVMQFKLPYVGDQSIPLQTFWDVMTGSCILPANQLCDRDPALTIGAIRARSLANELLG